MTLNPKVVEVLLRLISRKINHTHIFQVDYLRGLITLECMTIACIWVRYILNVRDFHKKAYRPDIYREDFVQMVCPENASALSEEVSVFY